MDYLQIIAHVSTFIATIDFLFLIFLFFYYLLGFSVLFQSLKEIINFRHPNLDYKVFLVLFLVPLFNVAAFLFIGTILFFDLIQDTRLKNIRKGTPEKILEKFKRSSEKEDEF